MKDLRIHFVRLWWELAVSVLALVAWPPGAMAAPATYVLRTARTAGAIDHVAIQLDVGGDVKEIVEGKVKSMKMSVGCTMAYDEKTLDMPAATALGKQSSDSASGTGSRWRGIRQYGEVSAVVKVENEQFKPAIRPDRRLIALTVELPVVTLFSPRGTLTRDELELIDILGNSLLLDALLPERPVAVGDQWKHSGKLMAGLLGLDAVSQTDAQSTLVAVNDTTARMELSGRVEGTLGGVSSEIELKAKYRYNLSSKRIDWVGLLVKEERAIGHVKRGVSAVARLQLTIEPNAVVPALADAALHDLPVEPTAALLQMAYSSAVGGWEFTHDRRWYITGEQRETAIFRMLDQGELIAQCNVSSLPKSPAGKEVTLAEFQEDVKRALGDNFRQFVEAGQSENPAGCRVYRVIVRGEVSQVAIQWNYYLLSDAQGHRVVFAFTMESKLADRLDQTDTKLVRSFRFGK